MRNYRFILLALLFLFLGCSLVVFPQVVIPFFIGILILILVISKYETITYFLACYPFLDFVFRNYLTSFSSVWDELLFIAMICIWAYKYVRYRQENGFKQTPLDLPIFVFIWSMLVVFILNSPDFSISFDGLRANIQYILWYFVVLQLLRDENSCKKICIIFIVIVGLMAIHGIYQYVIGVEVPTGWTDKNEAGVRTRVFSILTSPNILGSLMTLAAPICLSFIFIKKQLKQRLFFTILFICMLGSLLFTFSRGAWIGFAAAMFIYIILKDKRLIVPFFIVAALAFVLVPSVSSRIMYMLSPEYIESSLRGGRLIRWLTGLDIVKSYPVLGVGLGHFGGAVAMNNSLSMLVGVDKIDTFYMDNYYLKTAVETGVFGLFFFCMLMYQIIINSIRTIKITKKIEERTLQIGIFAGLFGIMVHNFVENVFEVPMMTSCFWVLVAVIMNFWYINFNKPDSTFK